MEPPGTVVFVFIDFEKIIILLFPSEKNIFYFVFLCKNSIFYDFYSPLLEKRPIFHHLR